MTAAVVASVTTLTATVDPAVMTVATADTAAVSATITLPVEPTVTEVDAMTATVVDVMTAVAAVADTLTATIVATAVNVVVNVVEIAMVDAHPVMQLRQPPMVTQPLAEMLGSHTEVDTTMMRNTPIVAIDR